MLWRSRSRVFSRGRREEEDEQHLLINDDDECAAYLDHHDQLSSREYEDRISVLLRFSQWNDDDETSLFSESKEHCCESGAVIDWLAVGKSLTEGSEEDEAEHKKGAENTVKDREIFQSTKQTNSRGVTWADHEGLPLERVHLLEKRPTYEELEEEAKLNDSYDYLLNSPDNINEPPTFCVILLAPAQKQYEVIFCPLQQEQPSTTVRQLLAQLSHLATDPIVAQQDFTRICWHNLNQDSVTLIELIQVSVLQPSWANTILWAIPGDEPLSTFAGPVENILQQAMLPIIWLRWQRLQQVRQKRKLLHRAPLSDCSHLLNVPSQSLATDARDEIDCHFPSM